MGLLVDTSVLVRLERTGRSPRDLIRQVDDELAISAMTLSELIVGLHRAQTSAQQNRRRTFVDLSLESLPVLSFDRDAAEIHAAIWAELVGSGQVIGVQDSLIAATALAHGYAVLTENVREFARVRGLEVRTPDW